MKLPEKSGKWIFRKYSEWDAFALHEFRSFLLRYSNDRQLQGKKKTHTNENWARIFKTKNNSNHIDKSRLPRPILKKKYCTELESEKKGKEKKKEKNIFLN